MAYIGHRIANGSFNRSLIPFSPDDIAYDCIADLFAGDGKGNYLQLQAYFGGINFEAESDEALLIHLRRLTFSKVNHGIFRIYNEADPSLGKILRNIKGAVSTLDNFLETEIFGEMFLTPSGCDPLRHMPVMEQPVFEDQFTRVTGVVRHIPALLGQLSLFLREQEEYRRSIPLMTAALVFRNVFSRHDHSVIEAPAAETAMLLDDARSVISEACAVMHREMSVRYIEKKHVDPLVFRRYFDVIELNLIQTLVEKDGHDFSFFLSLQSWMPELTREEYMRTHRSILEYAARLTREKALELFQ